MRSIEYKKIGSNIVDKTVDFIFSKDDRRWLILVVLLGLILRIIVASNLPPVEDESGSITHAIGFSKLAPLSQMAQAQVWYYLTDYSFRIFGVSLFTGRLLSIVFGTLSIILVYLLGSYIFNRKVGLVASFLLAISAYHITWTASYQDQTMLFFVLTAAYFFIKTYKEEGKISLLAAFFLGVAELVKIITGVFVLVFGAFSFYILVKSYKKNKNLFKENVKRAIIFVLILSIFMAPILIYNYLLFKEKGIVDLPFAQFLRINPEFYTGPGLHHGEGFVLHKLPTNLYTVTTMYFIREDALIFSLAVLGILTLLFRTKKDFETNFLLATFFFTLFFIASAIVLQTHYTTFFPFMSLFGAYFLVRASQRKEWNKHSKTIIGVVLLVILLFNVWNIHEPLTSKSALQKMREITANSISENSLIVVDSRIYTGTYAWIFHDRSYLNAAHFEGLASLTSQYQGQKVPIKTYFIECVNDDCGWGTIKDQPELNKSMEEMVNTFANVSLKVSDVDGGGSITGVRGAEIRGEPFYRVYEASLVLPPEVLELVKQSHAHFLYNVPRDREAEKAFDHYEVNGLLDNALNMFGYLVLFIAVISAFLSIGLPFYLLYRMKREN